MKKFLSFLGCMALIMGLALTASAEEGDQLSRIQQSGEIIVATEGAWAPWTYHDERDALVGFDVEVAQAIAGKLGVSASFVESEWDGIFAGLDAGRYDIAANGVEVTEERAQKYDFTTPYGYIRTALVVRGDNEEITSFEDLAGKRTANSIASTYMTLAESYGAEAVGVDTLDQTIEMVLSGRADATLNAEVSVYDYLRVHPDANIKVVALTEEASQVAIPVRKGEDSATLLAALNQAIEELAAEGELSRISEKYFGSDISGAQASESDEGNTEADNVMTISANGHVFTATLEENSSAQALKDMLRQGPLTIDMRDYANMEKVGGIGADLPTNDEQISTVPGDIILYQGNSLVIYYDTNDWNFTRLGKIGNVTGEELKEALGDGDVTVTFTLGSAE